MTIRLNEVALTALLDAQDGPVGLLVQRRAAATAEVAKANARIIMTRYPPAAEAVGYSIGENLQAVIGIRDEGSMSQYLADKAMGRVNARSEERWPGVGWLKAAAIEGLGD
jgi:hypothetical protein